MDSAPVPAPHHPAPHQDPRRPRHVFAYLGLRAKDGVEESGPVDYWALVSLLFAAVGVVLKGRIFVWLSLFALCSALANLRRSTLDSRTLLAAGMLLLFASYSVYIQKQ